MLHVRSYSGAPAVGRLRYHRLSRRAAKCAREVVLFASGRQYLPKPRRPRAKLPKRTLATPVPAANARCTYELSLDGRAIWKNPTLSYLNESYRTMRHGSCVCWETPAYRAGVRATWRACDGSAPEGRSLDPAILQCRRGHNVRQGKCSRQGGASGRLVLSRLIRLPDCCITVHPGPGLLHIGASGPGQIGSRIAVVGSSFYTCARPQVYAAA